MGFDLVKMTPLAEYIEMLYTRLALEMRNHPSVTRWWLEVHPPEMFDGTHLSEGDSGVVGYIKLKAMAPPKVVTYQADFMAAQKGARAGTDVLEYVVEHHVSSFVAALTAS